MKLWIVLPMLLLVLSGCAGETAYRNSCAASWIRLA
jgi:hypothetical protein